MTTPTIRAGLTAAHHAVILAQAGLVALDHVDARALLDKESILEAAEHSMREARTERYFLAALLPDTVLDVPLDIDGDEERLAEALRTTFEVKQPASKIRNVRRRRIGGAR